jgi:hypothetical protein
VTTHTPGPHQVHIARHLRLARPLAAAAAVVLAAVTPATAAAQDSTRILTPAGQPCSYDSCALRVEDGWFSRRLVRGPEGTTVARLGLGGPSLASVVQLSDSAVTHARRYQSAQRAGDIISLVGTVGSIAALVALDDDSDASQTIAINVGSAVVFAIGQGFHIKARRELSRSLWWYNREVLGTP